MGVLRRKGTRRLLAGGALGLGGLAALLIYGGGTQPYVPGERTEGLVDVLGRELPADHPRVTFAQVAAEAGIVFRHFPGTRSGRLPEDMGSGVALGDFDGDGWVDVFLANAAGPLVGADPSADGRSRLFHNLGGGRFADVTEASGIDIEELAMAGAFCDVDGDGDLDLFVTTYGACRLFVNDGSGRFRETSRAAGLEGLEGFWTGIAVGDYDRDGALDIYVCGYVVYDDSLANERASQYRIAIPARINPSAFRPERNLLLRGAGDGTFADVAEALGVHNPAGRSLGAVMCDLTGDGLPDLYVANDVSDNAFFVGRADGTFVDLTNPALLGDYRGAMGLCAADFDRDGDLDLYITHWVGQENALYRSFERGGDAAQSVPAPTFMDSADRFGLGHAALDLVGWATRFFDFDNDGELDLFVVNGSTIPLDEDATRLAPMRPQLFWNGGGERGFFELGAVAGDYFGRTAVGRGGATFDYDLDGDQDLLIVEHGGPAALLRNVGGGARPALLLRLRQPSGNTLALGAKVRLRACGRTFFDVQDTQGSYLSQHAAGELHFGLGQASAVDELDVTWPDGERESSGPIPADSLVTWVRGARPRVEPLPGKLAGGQRAALDVEGQRRFYDVRGRAGRARLAGELAQAVALYEEALALWPDHDDCLYYLGNCLLALGDEARALSVFERQVALLSASSRAWMQIGLLRLPGGDAALDDLALAAAAFERSHAINGEESRPVVQLGVCAMLAGDLERAAGHFADAARLNHRSIEARYFGGRVAFLRGQLERAHELLDEARVLALGQAPKDGSVSSEGQTRGGSAMTAATHVPLRADLERWRTLAERELDVASEYGSD